MSKHVLIDYLQSQHDLTGKAADSIVTGLLGEISRRIHSEGSFTVPGFGRWALRDKAARRAVNPRSKEVVEVPAKQVTRFTGAGSLAPRLIVPKRQAAKPARSRPRASTKPGVAATTASVR